MCEIAFTLLISKQGQRTVLTSYLREDQHYCLYHCHKLQYNPLQSLQDEQHLFVEISYDLGLQKSLSAVTRLRHYHYHVKTVGSYATTAPFQNRLWPLQAMPILAHKESPWGVLKRHVEPLQATRPMELQASTGENMNDEMQPFSGDDL
ncbi:hypothetical protein MFRU_009g03150 [Monilinia fructicola]|nr:hypothetical protein MFRU_009g03150 [Monilinia fructicola]